MALAEDIKKRNIQIFESNQEMLANDDRAQRCIDTSIKRQEFIGKDTLIPWKERFTEPAKVIVSRRSTLDAARRYREGKTAVLNFASATNPGGGVLKGSSAQEECICRCSTLYNCLNTEEMMKRFYQPHRNAHNQLNNDDIIYTPYVVITLDDSYKLLESSDMVDVITCAAPNLRPDKDGKEIEISNEDLYELHQKRATRILAAAAAHNVDNIILGAFGCGAFRNDPYVVANAYKTVLPRFLKCFKNIEFAVLSKTDRDVKNYLAFGETLIGPKGVHK